MSLLIITWLATTFPLCPATAAELDAPRDVTFQSKYDNSEQRYVIQLPTEFDPQQPHMLLIALHGHGSDRWQFVQNPRDECRAARDAAARHNCIYVSPDYRAATSWMGPAATADIEQILNELKKEYRVSQVIVSGGSMGGTSALAFATLSPDLVNGVVSLNGTANLVEYAGFPEAIAASYGGTRTEIPEVYRQRSAELFPEKLTMPIAMTTGGLDRLVPPDSCLRLANNLKQKERPVFSIHRPDGGHDTNYADATAAYEFVFRLVAASTTNP
ncbi:MAG: alpha/beta hydrolase [Planctomycetales bacterium 12-60-4]|nr:MAG: alpha/beta hydrolase [Planctomycetales bacterium 12-60-4]